MADPATHPAHEMSVQWTMAFLRRRAQWIALCLVVAAGAAYGLSKSETKRYTATAALVFSDTNLATEVAGLSTAAPDVASQSIQDTNVALVQTGDMAQKTARLLGHGLTTRAVKNALSVSAQGDTELVNVAATSTRPTLAARLANTYSGVFVSEQDLANHQYYVTALAAIDQQLARLSSGARAGALGLSLQDRAQSLATLAALPSGTVQIAAPASVPTAPSSPKILKTTIIAAVLGLLLGLGIALLVERVDQRIRDPRELEDIYGLPLLGVVPDSAALRRASQENGTGASLLPADAEAFQMMRAHLRYFSVDRVVRTLLVASASSGDGKTTIVRYLGTAAAQTGSRVLLVEADLRHPTLAGRLGVDRGPGLSDVLIDAHSLRDAIQTVDLSSRLQSPAWTHSLDVLVAGGTAPPNPGELLESQAMERLLVRAASDYDLVIIDTPPLAAVSDSFPLLPKVDGIVIVGRLGADRRDVAERLHRTLTNTATSPLLGVIANGLKLTRGASYGYAYGYEPAA